MKLSRFKLINILSALTFLLILVSCNSDDPQSPIIDNNAPRITAIGDDNHIVENEGSTVSFQLTASDDNIESLTFTWDRGNLPYSAEFEDNGDGSGDFTWETSFNDAGMYQPIFTVSDGNLTSSITIAITIKNVNRPPVWDEPNPNEAITGDENDQLTFEVRAGDPDGDDLSILMIERGGLPEQAVFIDSQDGTGVFSWTPGVEGEGHYTPTFMVSDGDLSTTVSIEIAIGNVNLAPVWESPNPSDPLIGREDEEFTFNISASDPDYDPVNIILSNLGGLPEIVEFTDNGDQSGLFTWITSYTDAGEYSPVFTLSDGEAERNVTLTIIITNRNRPPLIEDINDGNRFEAQGGERVELSLIALDPDGDALEFSMNGENLPQEADLLDHGNGTAEFIWETNPEDAGTYEPIFTVSDGDLTDDLRITITITEGDTLPHFSFFVTSLASIRELSGSEDGFGGDLRYGETGAGAGLRGADKICQEIAELSMAGSASKEWRAFLSVSSDENGDPVNAIDRIGDGPWYDRLGRLVAPSLDDLVGEDRMQNGDPTIQNDLPNEWGIPNHQPDPNQPPQDNHHMLTGSTLVGRLMNNNSTCLDWTTSDGSPDNGTPRCGMSWPRERNGRGNHWISEFSAPGCAAGVGTEGRPPPGSDTVGAGGGYGGFYCFGLHP